MTVSDRLRIRQTLRSDPPTIAVELRPPRAGLDAGAGMDAWIDLNHAVRRFTGDGRFVFFTDDAVGEAEEESLGHLAGNLDAPTERRRLIPFLTCKHPLDYCLLYAERAAALGLAAVTVVGGDMRVGPARCVEHAFQLRRRLRDRVPDLALGGWANPFRDPDEQAAYIADRDFSSDFFLTQVVTHHDPGHLAAMLAGARTRGADDLPALAGVFHYRSATPATLDRLSAFFPVPAEALTRDFDAGLAAEEITARSIRAALAAGADGVYVSNLGFRGAHRRLARILERASLG